MTVVDHDALVGRTLDQRYVIHERIARGGMASVYRATDLRLDRVVAVKVINVDIDAVGSTENVVREAKSAAKLNHRGIVSVYDQGVDGDTTYLVMEYVPGRTLRDVLRDEAPMPPRRALSYLEPVLTALSAAHDAGLVHRDIKPENVLISTTGEIKLADFGLARSVSNESTGSGVLVGTVSYLAPEIIAHQGADTRSDVYSCGAVLFEMLTGSKPHVADSPIAVAHKHVNEDVAPPSTLQPGLPPYLDALVLRALARDPAQRSPDARVLLHQVRQVQRALAVGLLDEPDLTRDLMPGAGPTPAAPPTLAGDLEPAPTAASSTAMTAPVAVAPGLADDQLTAPVRSGEPTTSLATTGALPRTDAVPTTVTGPAGPAGPPPAAPAATPPARRRRRGPLLLLIAIALLAGAALGGWYLAVGRYETVPNLATMSESEAVKTAEAAGFRTEVGPAAYSETVDKGMVISTDPDSGTRLLPDATITLTVSKGKERYEIPNIQGRTLEEATTALNALNLEVGDVAEEYSDKVATGGIIKSSNFKVGDLVKRDTAVDLVVSKGPKPIEITDYSGKAADASAATLRKAGFKVATTEQFSETVKSGVVISQTPDSGTGYRGDTISLVVSKGPERVAVPDLSGQTEAQAQATLAGVGLQLNSTRNPFSGDGATVRYQSPSPGDKVKRGSSVTVFLS